MENQEKINLFLSELKQLCDKHEVSIYNAYDESVYLHNSEGERLSEDIDFNEYKAAEYVKPVYKPRDPNFKPMSLKDMNAVIREAWVNPIKESLEAPSIIEELLKKNK